MPLQVPRELRERLMSEAITIMNPYECCTYKELAPVWERLKAMGFTAIVVHRGVSHVVDDTIYIFSRVIDRDECHYVEPLARTEIDSGIKIWKKTAREIMAPPADLWWTLSFKDNNGTIFAYYSVDNNLLWVCDITHLKGIAVPILRYILPFIEKERGIG